MARINPVPDTIAAIATPFGEGAIGIVRLSGPKALAIVDKIFLAKNKKPLSSMKSFSVRYGWIMKDKNVVDEVIVSLMAGPNSYTREDIVEINSHGGAKALSSILELVLEKGCRMSQPGEFTKRAFLNGRIDLAQAEAVLDVIQAKSELALKSSIAQLSGAVSRRIGAMRSSLLDCLADMEAQIDFSEDDISPAVTEEFISVLGKIQAELKSLLAHSFEGKIIRDGLKVVIYGKANVGKSSLLNAILKQERAIVSTIAGTTRDTIEEYISIKGLAVRLIDTAGMLEHRDTVEEKAIARTKDAVEQSDLVIFVLDATLSLDEDDKALARDIKGKKKILVLNKCDCPVKIRAEEIKTLLPDEKIVRISALTGEHIAQLEDEIVQSVFGSKAVAADSALISNMRHIEILKRSSAALGAALDTLAQKLSIEFAALDVKKSLDTLGELTGEVLSDNLLETIFSKFCVGK